MEKKKFTTGYGLDESSSYLWAIVLQHDIETNCKTRVSIQEIRFNASLCRCAIKAAQAHELHAFNKSFNANRYHSSLIRMPPSMELVSSDSIRALCAQYFVNVPEGLGNASADTGRVTNGIAQSVGMVGGEKDMGGQGISMHGAGACERGERMATEVSRLQSDDGILSDGDGHDESRLTAMRGKRRRVSAQCELKGGGVSAGGTAGRADEALASKSSAARGSSGADCDAGGLMATRGDDIDAMVDALFEDTDGKCDGAASGEEGPTCSGAGLEALGPIGLGTVGEMLAERTVEGSREGAKDLSKGDATGGTDVCVVGCNGAEAAIREGSDWAIPMSNAHESGEGKEMMETSARSASPPLNVRNGCESTAEVLEDLIGGLSARGRLWEGGEDAVGRALGDERECGARSGCGHCPGHKEPANDDGDGEDAAVEVVSEARDLLAGVEESGGGENEAKGIDDDHPDMRFLSFLKKKRRKGMQMSRNSRKDHGSKGQKIEGSSKQGIAHTRLEVQKFVGSCLEPWLSCESISLSQYTELLARVVEKVLSAHPGAEDASFLAKEEAGIRKLVDRYVEYYCSM
jgi:hypothetical protein